MTIWPAVIGCGVVIAVGLQPAPSADLSIQPAARYITTAFETYPLVAFSEPGHGAAGTREFFSALLRHPGFAGTVTDIVIESGNARYQPIADRYFSGEAVPPRELRQIWEHTTVVSGVWHLPVYEQILADIRAVNLSLPPATRIRVLLGDPPIDWSVVRGPADEDMNDWRDAHFAWVVEQQVLRKGRKALLWIGGAHTGRKVIFPGGLIHLLDGRFPGQTLVVQAVTRDQVSGAVLTRLDPWPAQRAASIRGTWLGRLDVREIGHRFSRGLAQDDVDAVVFWDPAASTTEPERVGDGAMPDPELRRRQRLAEATLPFRGGRIRFEAGTGSFAAGSLEALQAVLVELQRDPGLTLMVKAFADAREADGVALSTERARTVVAWLSGRGIKTDRLIAMGCGASRALWVGDTDEERAANRRAELVRHSPLAGCEPPSSFVIQ